MPSYSEKLKDPRWQKRRLEILERDNWECQICHDKTSTLHVHHKAYLKNLEPWVYPDSHLITLCESCHYNEQEAIPEIMESIVHIFKVLFMSDQLLLIEQALEHLRNLKKEDNELLAHTLAHLFDSESFRENIFTIIHEEMYGTERVANA